MVMDEESFVYDPQWRHTRLLFTPSTQPLFFTVSPLVVRLHTAGPKKALATTDARPSVHTSLTSIYFRCFWLFQLFLFAALPFGSVRGSKTWAFPFRFLVMMGVSVSGWEQESESEREILRDRESGCLPVCESVSRCVLLLFGIDA